MTQIILSLGEPYVDEEGYVVKGLAQSSFYLKNCDGDAYEVWHKGLWHPQLIEAVRFEYERTKTGDTTLEEIFNELKEKKLMVIGEGETPELAMEHAYAQTFINGNNYTRPHSALEIYTSLSKNKRNDKFLGWFGYDKKTKQFTRTAAKTKYSALVGKTSGLDMIELEEIERKAYLASFKSLHTLSPVELAWYIQNGYDVVADAKSDKYTLNKKYLKEGQKKMSVEQMRDECPVWSDTIKAIDKLYRNGLIILFDQFVITVDRLNIVNNTHCEN